MLDLQLRQLRETLLQQYQACLGFNRSCLGAAVRREKCEGLFREPVSGTSLHHGFQKKTLERVHKVAKQPSFSSVTDALEAEEPVSSGPPKVGISHLAAQFGQVYKELHDNLRSRI